MQELQRGPPVDAVVQTVLSGDDIQAGIEARAAIAEIAARPADSGDSAALSLASRANEAVDALRQHLRALEAQVSQLDAELKAHKPVVVDRRRTTCPRRSLLPEACRAAKHGQSHHDGILH